MIQSSLDSEYQFYQREAEARLNRLNWYALTLKSRHEKIADQALRKKGIETFFPIRKISRQWSDRKKIIEEPLFKGYLFVRIPWSQRLQVLNTYGTVRFVSTRSSDPIEVPEKDIFSIRRFLEEEIQINPFPYLREGVRVYIGLGPFKGAEGYIVRKGKNCRLVITLELLMQSVSVQIDEACVRPL